MTKRKEANTQILPTVKRRRDVKGTIFVWGMLIIPIVQFLIFYVGVKISSVTLCFQDYVGGQLVFGAGFSNFAEVFNLFFANGILLTAIKNSVILYLATFLMGPISIIVSYFLWKKIPFSGFFKVILFLPSVIPGMVFTLTFNYLVEALLPALFGNPELANLIRGEKTTLITLWLWGSWLSFGGGMVIWLGNISSVDTSVVEYGKIDGLGSFGEFWHIVLPHIYPTFTLMTIAGISGLVTADVGLYNFFGEAGLHKNNYTMGYFITLTTVHEGEAGYPVIAALGWILTFITLPILYTVKYLMEKFGPSEN